MINNLILCGDYHLLKMRKHYFVIFMSFCDQKVSFNARLFLDGIPSKLRKGILILDDVLYVIHPRMSVSWRRANLR